MLDEHSIKHYGEKVCLVLSRLPYGTFEEIQMLCHIGNTELCLVLIYLLRENKIGQEYTDGQVRYKI